MVRSLLAASLLTLPAPALAQEPVSLADGTLRVDASWQTVADTVYHFEDQFPLVRDLAPAEATRTVPLSAFRPFLPPPTAAVGDVWRLDPEDALPLLRQLHPGATADLHHDGGMGLSAHGAWACLRTSTPQRVEVVFRVHAEFLLAGDGDRATSSWFTPAQFRGRLVVEPERGTIAAFQLAVPEQRANVDLNIATELGIVADIGRVPRMELLGGDPSALEGEGGIPLERALDLLARRFYPFADLEWLDLPTALARSRETGKPLHVIELFGSLLDESC